MDMRVGKRMWAYYSRLRGAMSLDQMISDAILVAETKAKNKGKELNKEEAYEAMLIVVGKMREINPFKNSDMAEDESRVDEIIYKLRTLLLSTNPQNLVTQNEAFKQMVFEKNSYPFGEDGKQVSIYFFGTEINGKLDHNQYVVTNQCIYPKKEGGKRLDIVLLVNGFPFAIGELKTPVRAAITWLDGAQDINKYEQSIPQMFVTNVFNFATEGKCYRYGSVCMSAAKYGPWYKTDDKSDGSLAAVQASVQDMITKYKIMDSFQFFTLYAIDSKYRKYKVIARHQQYEGANMIIERVHAGYPKRVSSGISRAPVNPILWNLPLLSYVCFRTLRILQLSLSTTVLTRIRLQH